VVACAFVTAVLEIRELALRRADGFACELPQLTLRRGECVALVGPSGSGKSSLLRAAFGLPNGRCVHRGGEVTLLGERFVPCSPLAQKSLATHIAFLAQDARAALDPTASMAAQIARAANATLLDASAALLRLGVDAAHRAPHAVSGGEAQRAMFAVAQLRRAPLWVCDEPTAHLDDAACAIVAAAIAAHCEASGAALLATHDTRLLRALSCRTLHSEGGTFASNVDRAAPWPTLRAASRDEAEPLILATQLLARRGGRVLFSHLDLQAKAGRVLAIRGASGVGKTTLGRMLARRVRPDSGSVEWRIGDGLVAMVSQDAGGSLTPSRTLRSLARETKHGDVDLDAIANELALPIACLDRDTRELSLGEQRRGALLRALAADPKALVLDEPTASLDRDSAERTARAIRRRCDERGCAVVCITHDDALAASLADEQITLDGN
jgi:peptide/nickel transport system ATP-binding protein